jgi:hypothetical protein
MRRTQLTRSTLPVLLALWALWTAAPLAAYTVYLKDGSKIQAREKYTVDGARAIIVLQSGMKTFVPLAQIDVNKTNEGNRLDYGSAQVIPGGAQEVPSSQAAPPRGKTINDLLASREAGVRDLPEARRATGPGAGGATKLASGAWDLMVWTRKPIGNVEMAAELKRQLALQGIQEVEIYEGTKGDRPFVEITTNSEGSVFKTLAGSAATLPLLRQGYAKVGAIELLMITSERERAGQFTLTPEMADELLSKKTDLISFFLKNVQY